MYDLANRSLRDTLVDAALRNRNVPDLKKLPALESLAPLSYLPGLL